MTGDGNFLQRLVDLLDSAGIAHMIAGSVARAVELNIEDVLQRLLDEARPHQS